MNRTSRYLQKLIEKNELPPKLLAVHHFMQENIRGRNKIRVREDVQVTLNFDGIGSTAGKVAGYNLLAEPRLFNGFSLFYRLDSGLMRPKDVLALEPGVDYVMYQ